MSGAASGPVNLVFGTGPCERRLEDAESLLRAYRTDDGLRYLNYQPVSDPDVLVPDDLAVTILINSRVGADAFKSVQDRGPSLDLGELPPIALEESTAEQRAEVADLIAEVASWRGLGTSTVTKVLHKKRPRLIPILDNQAIFGAYMNPAWPGQRSSQDSVYAVSRIAEALDWIAFDLTRPENAGIWKRLADIEPARTRIDHFDMVWWTYFRRLEPVRPASST